MSNLWRIEGAVPGAAKLRQLISSSARKRLVEPSFRVAVIRNSRLHTFSREPKSCCGSQHLSWSQPCSQLHWVLLDKNKNICSDAEHFAISPITCCHTLGECVLVFARRRRLPFYCYISLYFDGVVIRETDVCDMANALDFEFVNFHRGDYWGCQRWSLSLFFHLTSLIECGILSVNQ